MKDQFKMFDSSNWGGYWKAEATGLAKHFPFEAEEQGFGGESNDGMRSGGWKKKVVVDAAFVAADYNLNPETWKPYTYEYNSAFRKSFVKFAE